MRINNTKPKVLCGFYLGIGDFVAAIPSIRALINSQDSKVYLAVSETNYALRSLVDIDDIEYLTFKQPRIKNLFSILKFFFKIKQLKFDVILISPHAQDNHSSWILPLILFALRLLHPHLNVVGAKSDRLSWLYNQKIPVDKSLPIMEREVSFLRLGQLLNSDNVSYASVFRLPKDKPIKKNLIIIHPGASKKVRRWHVESYALLCDLLLKMDSQLIIKFIGLQQELAEIQAVVVSPRVKFSHIMLDDAVNTLSTAKLAITMDSGFAHIASALGIPHVALYFSSDPNKHKPIYPNTNVIFFKKLPCQPCDSFKCKLGQPQCQSTVDASDIVAVINRMLLPCVS